MDSLVQQIMINAWEKRNQKSPHLKAIITF